jgi:hypothetical protein
MNPYVDQFKKISTTVLRQHIGVAAEFVVDDALDASRLDVVTEEMSALAIFLQNLANELPKHLPIADIMMEIKTQLAS